MKTTRFATPIWGAAMALPAILIYSVAGEPLLRIVFGEDLFCKEGETGCILGLEALVGDDHLALGRLGHDRRVGAEVASVIQYHQARNKAATQSRQRTPPKRE